MELIVIIIILLFILYLIIRWAIDGSETAENIRDIRNILSEHFNDGILADDDDEAIETIITDVPIDQCPACHSKVTLDDKECPSCGLSFNDV